ncbi:amidase domain-containing protein [Halobacillus campisalis]|uniref:Amidase domain-containing protein n=1 Tax=Halobacillus campisalis TaxID=435909 RepID=A0ABW2K1L7_9BACI|nr:amidase domain-containing protein [Halobacillus campisalis]
METIKLYWDGILTGLYEQESEPWLQRKVQGYKDRGQKVERGTFNILPYHRVTYEEVEEIQYLLKVRFFIKDGKKPYVEEGIYPCKAKTSGKALQEHSVNTEKILPKEKAFLSPFIEKESEARDPFTYDRREAVRYAERWWDSYNPAYKHFEVDCTNYISQCLHAGGGRMWGQPNRSKGWWYGSGNWSYSWSVAHSFRWYLSGARQGLVAHEVSEASDLSVGDVICYDFQGDGRFDHTTIIVSKDSHGEPLVNAHTTNSRQRYWTYTDSTAYTSDIKYKFFHIGG